MRRSPEMLSELAYRSAGTKTGRQRPVESWSTRLHTFFSKVPGWQGPHVQRGQSIPLTRTPMGSVKTLTQEQTDAETCSHRNEREVAGPQLPGTDD